MELLALLTLVLVFASLANVLTRKKSVAPCKTHTWRPLIGGLQCSVCKKTPEQILQEWRLGRPLDGEDHE
jgi:hypothetical protein